jgi:hypothetical protein
VPLKKLKNESEIKCCIIISHACPKLKHVINIVILVYEVRARMLTGHYHVLFMTTKIKIPTIYQKRNKCHD